MPLSQCDPPIGRWHKDFDPANFHLAQCLLPKAEVVERFVIRCLIPPEPLPDSGHVTWAKLFHILDIIEFLRQWVGQINSNYLEISNGIVQDFGKGTWKSSQVATWCRKA